MNQINIQFYKTQFYKNNYAEFVLGSWQGKLCLCDFRYRNKREMVDNRLRRLLKAEFTEQEDDLLELCKSQLQEYFSGQRQQFDLPLHLVGSEFQCQVWQALRSVGYGQTASYLDLAKAINNEKAVRAVANANGANALAVIVPCHRIIGNKGEMVGYGGGIELKKRLLALEKQTVLL